MTNKELYKGGDLILAWETRKSFLERKRGDSLSRLSISVQKWMESEADTAFAFSIGQIVSHKDEHGEIEYGAVIDYVLPGRYDGSNICWLVVDFGERESEVKAGKLEETILPCHLTKYIKRKIASEAKKMAEDMMASAVNKKALDLFESFSKKFKGLCEGKTHRRLDEYEDED